MPNTLPPGLPRQSMPQQPLPPLPPEPPKTSFVSNAIGIGGFVVLAIIVIWGLTHLFNISNPWLDMLFNTKSSISVTAPAQITSKDTFPIMEIHTKRQG